jgi:hypothetical protein
MPAQKHDNYCAGVSVVYIVAIANYRETRKECLP